MQLPKRSQSDPAVRLVLAHAGAGERLLAWGRLHDGGVVVCTVVALHAPTLGRVTWDQVVRGSWSEGVLELVIKSLQGRRTARLDFDDAGQVPAVVRERIEWSVLASQHVVLRRADGRSAGAQISARRSPETDEITWGVVFDAGVDAGDQAWRAAADEAVGQLRASLGI